MLAAGLGGCGLRPLYGRASAPGGGVVAELAAIRVAPIDGRAGQLLRNHLLDALNPTGQPVQPRWLLDVSVLADRNDLAKQADDVTTRVSLSLTAEYALRDPARERVLTKGTRRSIAGYNLIQSEYANLIASQDAEARAAQQLAQLLAQSLSVHFASGPGS